MKKTTDSVFWMSGIQKRICHLLLIALRTPAELLRGGDVKRDILGVVELDAKTLQHVEVMYMRELEYEIRCRVFFAAIWKFLIGNRDKCLAFVRYYYSPYFQKYSAEKHRLRYQPLMDKFSPAFIEEADVWMILNHILNVMLDFAVKVHNGQMSSDDDYAEHVFRVVYRSIEQYFKKGDVQTND